VSDPEGIRHVLMTATGKYKRPMSSYRVFRPFSGSGVLLAEGGEWRRQRRMLASIFTPSSVGLLLPHFTAAATDLVRRIEGTTRANLSTDFQEATLEAVLRALFSLPDAELRERLAALVRSYLAGPGRPNILDGLAKTESAFAFATTKRRKFENAWHTAVDDLIMADGTQRLQCAMAICSICSSRHATLKPGRLCPTPRFATSAGPCSLRATKPRRGCCSGPRIY
jgi:cytochrome P450